ncbi:hypothetical protein XELAEV_18003742mg [Xenopus laevis]|nr:hypothetical protein XELAEV_18003742mg [Xenopus laevis]
METFWDSDARLSKANLVFGTSMDTSHDDTHVFKAFRDFELNLIKELHKNEAFINSWNKILTDCSIRLMELMIEHKTKLHLEVKADLRQAEKEVEQFKDLARFENLYDSIKRKVKKIEEEIMDNKRNKFNRDSLDYMKDQVYNWAQTRLPLKKSFSSADQDFLDSSLSGSSTISSQSNRGEKIKEVFMNDQPFLQVKPMEGRNWDRKKTNRSLWKKLEEESARREEREEFSLRKRVVLKKYFLQEAREKSMVCKILNQELWNLKKDKSLVIKNADKGGMVVVQDAVIYKKEAMRQLNDREAYTVLRSDPMKLFMSRLIEFVDGALAGGLIDTVV